MKMSRSVYVLSVLLVLVLICGIIPAAYADNSCICTPAQEKNPACTCGCNQDMKSMREEALQEFLMCTMAAENETDLRTQAALYRQAAELWESYMDIVLSAFEPELAAEGEMLPPEPYGMIGGMDGPTDIYLRGGREDSYDAYPYFQNAPAAAFGAFPDMRGASDDSIPAAPDMPEDQLSLEDQILEQFMMYMFMAREETDPAVRERLYLEAGELWDTYMYLTFGTAGEYPREDYGPEVPMEGQRPGRPQPGGYGEYGPRGSENAPAPEQGGQLDPYQMDQNAYNKYMAEAMRAAMTDSVVDILSEGIIGQSSAGKTEPAAVPADPYLDTNNDAPCGVNTEPAVGVNTESAAEVDTEPAAEVDTEPAAEVSNEQIVEAMQESLTNAIADILTEGIINQPAPTVIGLPNPWVETDSLEEAIRISGVDVNLPAAESLPQNMKLTHYRAVPGTLEADYSNGEEKLMFRASVDDDGYNLSGDYNTYSQAWRLNVGDCEVDCLGNGEIINIALFWNGDKAYALTMACGKEGTGLTADEMAGFVAAVLPAAEEQQTEAREQTNENNGEIIVLFTSDVQCGIDEGVGYAGVKTIRDSLESQGYTTILVDGGNAVQGGEIGELSRGEAIIDFMNAVGYDAAIPGVHETDYGEEQFLALVKRAEFPYISCNFKVANELALEPYVIVDAADKKIAFVGVNMSGNDGQAVEALQNAINDARGEGAEIVYVIGHMTDGINAAELVANTTGIDVFLDNNGGEAVVMNDKADETVLYVSAGAKLSKVGYSRINAAGAVVETGVWVLPEGESVVIENEITEMVEAANQKLAALKSEAEAQPVSAEENHVNAEAAAEPAQEASAESAQEANTELPVKADELKLSDEELANLKALVDYLYAMRQAK